MAEAAGAKRERAPGTPEVRKPAVKAEPAVELGDEDSRPGSCLGRMAFIAASLVMLLAAVVIVLMAANKAGWININEQLKKVPFLSGFASDNQTKEVIVPGTTLLERENQRLLQELNTQREELQQLTAEKKTLDEYNKALTEKVSLLEKTAPKPKEDPVAQMDFKQLAAYFSEMKPANAVAIMDKMDDDTVLGILRLLESDKVAKILAAMPPERAAALSSKFKINST
ncbi:MAG: hypothetical protein HPY50_14880 [Firmicutes bacterium]|nr:hypothetical protein [Bacillota bacterium]